MDLIAVNVEFNGIYKEPDPSGFFHGNLWLPY